MPDLWLGPDLDADLLELVDYPDQWPIARSQTKMLQMFQQQIGADDPASYNPLPQWVADLIPNYYPRLANADFFERLGKLGLSLAIETPGLKAWSPDGVQAAFALQTACNRVRAAGYVISAFSLDDPLGASVGDFPDSPWPIERAVPAVVEVLKTGDANGVRGGITEAYPLSSAANIIHFFELIQQAGYSPAHMHLDVDEQAAKQQRTNKQIAQDFNDLRVHCQAWGIPFGIILNGQRGDDPQSYRTGFWEWHDFALRMLDGVPPDRWILESWKKNNLPVNLPETSQFSHTGLLREVAALSPFPEPPEEPSMPSGAKFIVFAIGEEFHLGHEVAQRDGLVTVERTYEAPEPQDDGTMKMSCVLSIQQDGSIGWRPRGTNGPFELAQPAPGFYLYGPGIRLQADLKLPVYPIARFPEFTL